ncbi:MAG: ABC transporter permease [Dethiobacter sp.]|jgi:putative ABC transport system permease protein|nr:ABC transporter permease [Dethiobacter sp.]
MRLDDLAYKNICRRKSKIIFPLVGILIAVTTAVSLFTITREAAVSLADTFDEIGANIMIVPLEVGAFSYGDVVIPGAGGEMSYLETEDVIRINTIEERDSIAFVAPKILTPAEISGQQVLVVGVDFPQELQMKRWWRYYGDRPRGVKDVLLGSRAARSLGLGPGDSVKIEGNEFTVTAVLEEQGSEEDDFVFMQLLTVQDMFGLDGRLSFIEVAAYCTTCPLPEIVRQIGEALPNARVTALAEVVRSRQEVVDRFFSFSVVSVILLSLTAALIVLVTMLASIRERTREIGIMRSLGFRRRHILEVILTEVALIGLAGGAGGYIAGSYMSLKLAPFLLDLTLKSAFNPALAYFSVLGALTLTLAAGAYPAYKASSIDPITALGHI